LACSTLFAVLRSAWSWILTDQSCGDPDFTFRLPHPRMARDRAEVEIHRHDNGLWM
jgi:hypothetical protein